MIKSPLLKTPFLLLSLALSTMAQTETPSTPKPKPNVLFILIDDFGWNDVGYNGSSFYETPHMDQLAKEWMRFDYAYASSPMCSPTRTSILTGKNPERHGVTQWLSGRDTYFGRKNEEQRVYCPGPQSSGIKDDEVTLGEAFQEAGYETAFYGKWHMGTFKETGGPKNHGYDSETAVVEANRCSMFYPFGDKNYFPRARKGDNYTDLLTDAAVKFVSKKRKEPFYLHLSHFAMHAPIASKEKLRKKFDRKRKKLDPISEKSPMDDYSHQHHRPRQDDPHYAGELATLDENIGRIVETLKKKKLYDNTIIILTGDNGGRSSMNKSRSTSVSPLRLGKTFLFEGGIRTPTLIHWPEHSQPGMHSSEPVISTDFYPTLLEMAGLPSKPEQHLDGKSLVPLFKGESIERDTLYFHFPHYQAEGSYPGSAIRVGKYKLIHNYHHGDVLLFDLEADPYEKNNLAEEMPEKAAELDAQLIEHLEKMGAFLPQPMK